MSHRTIDLWRAEPIWKDGVAVVVGSGPSLVELDPDKLRRANCIAVNSSYAFAPWAQFLFFHDRRWLEWNGKDVSARFNGKLVSTSGSPMPGYDKRVLRMKKEAIEVVGPLATDNKCLCGHDSGYLACNMAFHFGVKRIVLVGFDMAFKGGQAHWHPDHKVPSREDNYTQRFLPSYAGLKAALEMRGVELVKSTTSAISCKAMPIEEALKL